MIENVWQYAGKQLTVEQDIQPVFVPGMSSLFH